jgi:hypothetical protein
MMMACGHVITKDSLTKLSKSNGYALHLHLVFIVVMMFSDVSNVRTAPLSQCRRMHCMCISSVLNGFGLHCTLSIIPPYLSYTTCTITDNDHMTVFIFAKLRYN